MGDPAGNALAPEGIVEGRQVPDSIQQGHYQRVLPEGGSDRRHSRWQVVGLAGKDDQPGRGGGAGGLENPGKAVKGAAGAFHTQALPAQGLGTAGPHEEAYVSAGFDKSRTEVAANGPGPQDQDAHGLTQMPGRLARTGPAWGSRAGRAASEGPR